MSVMATTTGNQGRLSASSALMDSTTTAMLVKIAMLTQILKLQGPTLEEIANVQQASIGKTALARTAIMQRTLKTGELIL